MSFLIRAQAPTQPERAPSLRDRFARVIEAVTSPLLPADYLDLIDPLRAGAELRGRVIDVQAETADAATLIIKPGRDWAGHVPGQYVRIGVDVNGVREWRAYSLTHGPRNDRNIAITVKAVPDGLVSNHLVHHAPVGALVHLEQATGEFVLPPDSTKLLFVTAGSGITPVIGMLRNLFPVTDEGVLVHTSRDIVVLHVAPSAPDSIFRDDLQTLHEAGAIHLIARYDDQHGVLDVNELSMLIPDLAERTTFACGPGGLLDALEEHHSAHDLPLFTEQFRATVLAGGEGGAVTFASQDGAIEADGSTPLLEVGEAAGVLMPSGCRMGVCFGCVLPLREGVVRDLRNGQLTRAVPGETNPGGVPIQTCISAAAGPCHLDI